MEYDIFISHASEDKESFVEPLAKALIEAGLKVWYDRFELKLGDSLREKIDQGLANSTYGVVVLSKSFFAKDWPKAELDALVTRQNKEGKKVILPIWHEVEAEQVGQFSPILASKLAARSSDGIDAVVAQIMDACSNDTTSRPVSVFQAGAELGLREQCLEIIRQDNIIEWRKLIAELTQPIPGHLKEWKSLGESDVNKGNKGWEQALIEAAKICLPGFVPIFAAIETGKTNFWKESLGIVRRLAILRDEMGAGTVCVLNVGSHMLYVANSIGMAVATNVKLLDLVNDWMQLKMPNGSEGERTWLQVRSAHYLPEGIGFNIKQPFTFLKNIYSSTDATNFFANEEHLVHNVLLANLLCSLIELRCCSQNKKCLDSIMNQPQYFYFDVWPAWGILNADQFKISTLELFGDSKSVVSFVFPSGFMTPDKFWPLWKRWKEHCLNFWWNINPKKYDFLMKKPWMSLPGEPAD